MGFFIKKGDLFLVLKELVLFLELSTNSKVYHYHFHHHQSDPHFVFICLLQHFFANLIHNYFRSLEVK